MSPNPLSAFALIMVYCPCTSSGSIPTVDMSQSPEHAAAAVFDAASKYGFFYLENHGIPSHDTQQALFLSKNLFDWYLSANVCGKVYYCVISVNVTMSQYGQYFLIMIQVNLSSNATHWGYIGSQDQTLDPGNQQEGDTKMGFYIAHNDLVSDHLNQWPDIPEWRDHVQSYMDQMHRVSDTLAQLIALSLNLSADYLDGSRDEGQ